MWWVVDSCACTYKGKVVFDVGVGFGVGIGYQIGMGKRHGVGWDM